MEWSLCLLPSASEWSRGADCWRALGVAKLPPLLPLARLRVLPAPGATAATLLATHAAPLFPSCKQRLHGLAINHRSVHTPQSRRARAHLQVTAGAHAGGGRFSAAQGRQARAVAAFQRTAACARQASMVQRSRRRVGRPVLRRSPLPPPPPACPHRVLPQDPDLQRRAPEDLPKRGHRAHPRVPQVGALQHGAAARRAGRRLGAASGGVVLRGRNRRPVGCAPSSAPPPRSPAHSWTHNERNNDNYLAYNKPGALMDWLDKARGWLMIGSIDRSNECKRVQRGDCGREQLCTF